MGEAPRVAADGLAAGELPIGAVVVLDDAIVASAYTQERTQRRLLVHADLLALDAADRLVGRRRRDATLYVTLEPCLACLGAAMTTMVGSVVYALESPSDGATSLVSEWNRTRRREDFSPPIECPTFEAVSVERTQPPSSITTLSVRVRRTNSPNGRDHYRPWPDRSTRPPRRFRRGHVDPSRTRAPQRGAETPRGYPSGADRGRASRLSPWV
jgi:tRNA(Arg) A34 adenosine deaminase TadA